MFSISKIPFNKFTCSNNPLKQTPPKTSKTLLLAILSILAISVSTEHIEIGKKEWDLYGYNYDEKNLGIIKTGRKFNFANGRWYYLPNNKVLEFHPNHEGMIFFSSMNNSEFIYVKTPERILCFFLKDQDRYTQVRPSLFKERDYPHTVMKVFPTNDMDIGDFKKLNKEMIRYKETVFVPYSFIDQRPLEFMNKIPYYKLTKSGSKMGNGYSNHAMFLLHLQEDLRVKLENEGKIPTDFMSLVEGNFHYQFQMQWIQQLVKFMYTMDKNYIFYRAKSKKELLVFYEDIAFGPSVIKLARDIMSTEIFTQKVQPLMLEISQKLVEISVPLAMDYVFKNGTEFFRNIFRFYNPSIGIDGTLHKIQELRNKPNLHPILSHLNNKVLEPSGLEFKNDGVYNGSLSPYIQFIRTKLIEVFDELYPLLQTIVPQLDKSQGVNILNQILSSGKIRDDYEKTYIRSAIEIKRLCFFDVSKPEKNKEAFEALDFADLVFDFLNERYIGQVLNVLEPLFFDNMVSMKVFEKIGMVPDSNGRFGVEDFEWIRRLFMILGQADFDSDLDSAFMRMSNYKIFDYKKSRLILV
jgi:hypothetical protein